MEELGRLEQAVGKGAFNPSTTKILHLGQNPMRQAKAQRAEDAKALEGVSGVVSGACVRVCGCGL